MSQNNNYEIAIIAGEQYQVPETGLTEPEIRSLFEAMHPGVITATVETTVNSDGVKVWTFTEKGGTKG